jgi:4'-phosphopantetheinyl transferase
MINNNSRGLTDVANVIYILYYKLPRILDSKTTLNLIGSLSIKDQKFLLSIQNKEAQRRSLVGRIMLKYITSELCITDSASIQMTSRGKPYFSSHPYINYNISHSGKMVVCCVTLNSKIGIDVEIKKTLRLNNFHKYFQPEEWIVIQNSSCQISMFFDLWTRKEALIKADGRGMEIDLKSLNGLNNSEQIGANKWFLQNIELIKNYSCAIACEKIKPIKILNLNKTINFDSFLNVNLMLISNEVKK